VLAQKSRGGQFFLRAPRFHSAASLEQNHLGTRLRATLEYTGANEAQETGRGNAQLCDPYCFTDGRDFRLKAINPADTGPLKTEDKVRAKKTLQMGIDTLAKLQDVLYAQDSWAVLLIFQAMDAAGKDGAVKHVMSGINPQGCQVASFQGAVRRGAGSRLPLALPEEPAPTGSHRYLQSLLLRRSAGGARASRVSRKAEAAHPAWSAKKIWDHRFEDICAFERYLTRNGIAIRKFFLHISYAEQERRFLERLNTPEKNWKFLPRTSPNAGTGGNTWPLMRT